MADSQLRVDTLNLQVEALNSASANKLGREQSLSLREPWHQPSEALSRESSHAMLGLLTYRNR